VEVTRHDSWRGSEIIALLCFRKHVRHVVSLVAPRVHIDRREKDSEARVQDESVLVQVVRNTDARSEIEFIGVVQTFRKTLLPADKYKRHAVLKRQIGVWITNVDERAHVFITKTHLDRCVASNLKAVMDKSIRVPLAQL